MSEVPSGWVCRKLNDLGVAAQPGFASGKHHRVAEGVIHLRPMNISRAGELTLADVKYVNDDSDRRVIDGDVLFNNTNSPALVGKTAYISVSEPLAYSNHMTRLRVDEEIIDARFLALQMHSLWLGGYFSEICSNHVNQASVATRKLLETEINLPPLDEQRRIVATLEDHLSRLTVGQGSLDAVVSRIGAFRASLASVALRGLLVDDDLSEGTGVDLVRKMVGSNVAFDAAESDRIWDLPETWTWARLGDLFAVSVGATPSRTNPQLWAGDLPWVSSGEVAFNRIKATREAISRQAAGNPERRIHPPGTVLLAMIGEGKTRGQAAILDIEAAHNQNCASIRVSETPILPEYVFMFLEERYAETRRTAAGGNQPALNGQAVKRIPIPVPPLRTQRLIVERVGLVEDSLDRTRSHVKRASLRGDRLRMALLRDAFSGSL